MTVTFVRARNWNDVARHAGPGTIFMAAGTALLPLIADGVEAPVKLIDINGLGCDAMELDGTGDLVIGGLVTMSDVARNHLVREHAPALAQSILASASPQVRNMGSIVGNLMQRTRCAYFRDPDLPCNRRAEGAGCPAFDGHNRSHAVFGASKDCCATGSSDIAVALAALDAEVIVKSAATGERRMPVASLYQLSSSPAVPETSLAQDELIIAISLPCGDMSRRSSFTKMRDRASFEYSLVSVAVACSMSNGRLESVRIALGGVAYKPWRLAHVEERLAGCAGTPEDIATAFNGWDSDARPLRENGFKLVLAQALATRAVSELVDA